MYYYQVNKITSGPIASKRYMAKRLITDLTGYLHQDIYLLDDKMRKIEFYDFEEKCWVIVNE